MNYLQLLLSFVAGANFLAGIVFIFTAIRIEADEKRLYLFLSIMCFSLAILLSVDGQLYYTPTVDDTSFLLAKLAVTSGTVFHLALIWFVSEYTKVKPRIFLAFITITLIVIIVVNPFFTVTLVDQAVHDMIQVNTSWGEVIYFPDLDTSIWAIPVFLILVLMFIYFIVATVIQFKKGQVRDAITLGIPITIGLIASMRDLLVDIIKQPDIFVTEIFFFSIVLVMSIRMSQKVIESIKIKKELIKGEKRWGNLLESVELVVIGINPQGIVNYINPYYLKTTGFQEEEVLTRPFSEVMHQSEQELFAKNFASLKNTKTQPHYQNVILTKSGKEKIISWTMVALYDRENQYIGSLVIGADVTEREEAFREVQQLKDRLQEENIYLQEEIILDHNFRNIIGKSKELKYVLARISQVAPTNATVLIEGETGTGKELVARAIHHSSHQKDRPLVKINCTTIPAALFESELFGHVKGAFTGADRDRKGRFEIAHKGVLFLDEIAEMPIELQPKLLRVLEEGMFEQLGSNKTQKVEVRIITATNRNLKQEVEKGTFREDLYYRLSTYPISMPPLRKRKDDILPLVEYFVDQFSRKLGKHIDKISKDTQEILLDYDWPGNVRELRNVIERAVIGSSDKILVLSEILSRRNTESINIDSGIVPLQDMERQHILKALEVCANKISGKNGAAEMLGLHPNTLHFRMQKLGIKKPTAT
jgi:PAS domain S-box-containing protein